MNYINGIFVVGIVAIIVTLLGQIPYQFCNQEKLKRLYEQKGKLKVKLKGASDTVYMRTQKQIIKINLQINLQIIIPLIIQIALIMFVLGKLHQLNPVFLWILWYVGFAMLFNRMWKKVLGGWMK